MNNIKKIYQHAGECDDQQNLKDIIEAALLSTTEGFIDNSPNMYTWITRNTKVFQSPIYNDFLKVILDDQT